MRKFLLAASLAAILAACGQEFGGGNGNDEFEARLAALEQAKAAPPPTQPAPASVVEETPSATASEQHYCTTGVEVESRDNNDRAVRLREELEDYLADVVCEMPESAPGFHRAPDGVTITYTNPGDRTQGTARSQEGDEFRFHPATR